MKYHFHNKTIISLTIFCGLLFNTTNAQNLIWADVMGGDSSAYSWVMALDNDGNVYSAGYFRNDTADFDPGSGVYNLVAQGLNTFISKLDANGNFVWAKSFEGTDNVAEGIEVDDSGNVFLAGKFYGTNDFDPGSGIDTMTAASWGSIFICKLDVNGNYVWAKKVSPTNGGEGRTLAIDAAGNVYVSGWFQGTADFDPGIGISNLTSVGLGSDCYIMKLTSAGVFAWVKQIGGTSQDGGVSITIDILGNILLTGDFGSTVDFDPGFQVYNLTASGGDIFILKLTASGNFAWATNLGGSLANIYGESLKTDLACNIYLGGRFGGTADFDPSGNTQNLTAIGYDAYVCKFDPSGNYQWAHQFGGPSTEKCYSIDVDATGNVYSTGIFHGATDFDPGAGNYTLISSNQDLFVSKLSTNGNFVWAWQLGITPNCGITGYNPIAVDGSGNIYLTSGFWGQPDMNPGTSVNTIACLGVNNVFVAKLNQITGVEESNSFTEINLFPNPSNGNFELKGNFPANSQLHIYDLLANEVVDLVSIAQEKQTISVSLKLADGIYIYRIISENKVLHDGKIVIANRQ